MLQRTPGALVLLLLVSLSLPTNCFSQQDETHKRRKVVNEVTRQYPALACTDFSSAFFLKPRSIHIVNLPFGNRARQFLGITTIRSVPCFGLSLQVSQGKLDSRALCDPNPAKSGGSASAKAKNQQFLLRLAKLCVFLGYHFYRHLLLLKDRPDRPHRPKTDFALQKPAKPSSIAVVLGPLLRTQRTLRTLRA
jgi:hypothetical protein